jgi:hypothetical protein
MPALFSNKEIMACTGLTISSPDISCLDFLITWDISVAAPKITLTNNSTVANPNNLTWWYVITTPSGVFIHQGSQATPDVTKQPWTTLVVPNLWPTPFGNPPCGQIEFSPNSPYVCTLYVMDSLSNIYSLQKNAVIPRPNGNSIDVCGNFGVAQISMKVDCANKNILLFDGTNTIYNNITPLPASITNLWTLVYPQDASGNIPSKTANNVANVSFPISINSENYSVYFNESVSYDYGNGTTVKVQYKLFQDNKAMLGKNFAINCNTNLCALQCWNKKLRERAQTNCGTLENAALDKTLIILGSIYDDILTGIFQPLCGINVPKLIEEWKRVAKFDENCDCGCDGDNFGFSNPTGIGGSGGGGTSGCCPVYTNVIDAGTGFPPASCPNGYFPCEVNEPSGGWTGLVANSMSDLIAILNADPNWQAYGTAFDAGNCKVGFFPLVPGTIIPPVTIGSIPGSTGGGDLIANVFDLNTAEPPVPCPGPYFPCQVYSPSGPGFTVIGIANNITDLVGLLNSTPAWQAYGVAYIVDNCHVGFHPNGGIDGIPTIFVTFGAGIDTTCNSGSAKYPVTISDSCVPTGTPITALNFPFTIFIDLGLGTGPQAVRLVNSQGDMIAALNGWSGKPAGVTFAAGGTIDQVIVTVDCTVAPPFTGTVTLTADVSGTNFLLFAPNHLNTENATPPPIGNSVQAYSYRMNSVLGAITMPSVVGGTWHSIQIGNYLLGAQPATGKIYLWDVSSPLNPFLIKTVQLSTVVAACFTGNPLAPTYASGSTAVPELFSLYFPTDPTGTHMSINQVYVFEANTGVGWQLNMLAAPGSEITSTIKANSLIGKCPRVFINGLIYFTQDGSMLTDSGRTGTDGLIAGTLPVVNTATFSPGGISTITVINNGLEEVWAASYDGIDTIYFIGQKTTIVKWTVSTNSRNTVYNQVGGSGLGMKFRCNSSYLAGTLFVTPTTMPPFNGMIIDTSTLGGTVSIRQFQNVLIPKTDGMWTFTPLGNCYGVLTTSAVPFGASGPTQARVLVYKTDGTWVAVIPTNDTTEIYNVVPVNGVYPTTPNSFVAP